MGAVKLSKRTIDRLTVERASAVFWDSELPGFGIRVHATGRKLFVAQARTPSRLPKRATVGRYEDMDAEDARLRAAGMIDRTQTGSNGDRTMIGPARRRRIPPQNGPKTTRRPRGAAGGIDDEGWRGGRRALRQQQPLEIGAVQVARELCGEIATATVQRHIQQQLASWISCLERTLRPRRTTDVVRAHNRAFCYTVQTKLSGPGAELRGYFDDVTDRLLGRVMSCSRTGSVPRKWEFLSP